MFAFSCYLVTLPASDAHGGNLLNPKNATSGTHIKARLLDGSRADSGGIANSSRSAGKAGSLVRVNPSMSLDELLPFSVKHAIL